ncbi:MAG: radical SAM protein [Spirochaetes bacterium]|nr:radical SAM protein [Spirochaetota bacterium]
MKDLRQQRWRHRLNFYAFIASLLGEGDVYPPTEFAHPVSKDQVVKAWKGTADAINKGQAPKQLGIFIFVPFCRTKCLFCPYFSFALSSGKQLDIYTRSIIDEMNFFQGVFNHTEFNTVWFGGGTPSILEKDHLTRIFSTLYDLFPFTRDLQITFECSCSSTDYYKLKLLHQLGVNRITLGIQSLNDRVLKVNNRLYQNRKESMNLINDARKAGIEIVNIDLMCGLPGDNLRSFLKGLKEIMALEPDMIHINPFFPSDETHFDQIGREYSEKDMKRRSREANLGTEILLKAGYKRADGAFLGFCRREGVCNQQEIDRVKYTSSYLSFGPSAESHAFGQMDYTNAYFGKKWNKPVLPRYIGRELDVKEEMRKHIVSNLRKVIVRKDFKNLFGGDIVDNFKEEIEILNDFNLVHIDQEKIFFKIKTRQEQLILAKHFFKPAYLKGMATKFKVRFNKNKNYFKEITKLIDSSV